jgi:acyl-CoA dehydrogenase
VNALLHQLFSLPLETSPNHLKEWWPWVLSQWASCDSLFEKAVLGGASTDYLGFAFAAGYHAALRSLFPALPEDQIAALCATEALGVHPKAIQTTLSNPPRLLSGQKTFTTLADHAKILFVVANTDGRLVVVRVNADAPGVKITPLPLFPFVPEISHAEVLFTEVPIEENQVLPGDGYDTYLKPFRTIEDIFVHAAALGHIFGVARKYKWPEAAIEDIIALLLSLQSLTTMAPLALETHLALSGVIRASRKLLKELEPNWERCPEEIKARWQRDQKLLQVAEKVRQQRTESAWKKMLLTKL